MADSTNTIKQVKPYMGNIASQGFVVVKIGPLGIQYHVHKALLVRHSEYFQKALSGPWKEAEAQTVTMADVEPCIFARFVHWLYHQTFSSSDHHLDTPNPDWRQTPTEILTGCTRAYVFGDRFLVPGFRRAANNWFATALQWHYIQDAEQETLIYTFENLSSESIMVQHLVDEICRYWDNDDELDFSEFYSKTAMSRIQPAILRRVARRCLELGKAAGSIKAEKRCYFEHESDDEIERCGKLHMSWDDEKELAFFE